MRLIDADALKEEVNKKNVVGRFNTIMLIDNAPTVEAVSVEHHNKIKGLLDNEIRSLIDILDKEKPQCNCENCDLYFKAMTKQEEKNNDRK